jgi:hypothetical protein
LDLWRSIKEKKRFFLNLSEVADAEAREKEEVVSAFAAAAAADEAAAVVVVVAAAEAAVAVAKAEGVEAAAGSST